MGNSCCCGAMPLVYVCPHPSCTLFSLFMRSTWRDNEVGVRAIMLLELRWLARRHLGVDTDGAPCVMRIERNTASTALQVLWG